MAYKRANPSVCVVDTPQAARQVRPPRRAALSRAMIRHARTRAVPAAQRRARMRFACLTLKRHPRTQLSNRATMLQAVEGIKLGEGIGARRCLAQRAAAAVALLCTLCMP